MSVRNNTQLVVVLVRTIYPRNIGSVARVMSNLGADKLILIDPQCELNIEARQGAAGAQHHLLSQTTYKSWADFYSNEPEGIRVAFCARSKKDLDPVDFRKRSKTLSNEFKTNPQFVYLIFGPEDHGLENQDLDLANYICTLPIFGSFNSYNLSHAVLIALYILIERFNEISNTGDTIEGSLPEIKGFNFPEHAIKTWLETIGFTLGGRRTDAYLVIKRILLRNLSSNKELNILEAIVFQTIRKLNEFANKEKRNSDQS